MNVILKATTKGQITLPAKWRRSFNTDQYLVTSKGGMLEVRPVDLKSAINTKDEYTVFDAIRDNKGKGIKAKDLVKVLKKMT